MVVPIPRALRPEYGKTAIYKKAGNTYQEATRNGPQLEMFIRQGFDRSSPVKEATGVYGDLSKLSKEEEYELHEVFLSDPRTKFKDVKEIHSAMSGMDTWSQWVEKRIKQEDPAGSTVTNWNSYLGNLSDWYGNECLHEMTKDDAIKYKEHLLERMERSSARKVISCHKGFWNWAKTHNQLKENIWDGLTRKLDSTKKKPLPPQENIQFSTDKAIEKKDYRFLIMRFTGCRSNEANGLRHCDVDLKERTISFVEWEKDGKERRLKGREKDERTVPISDALFEGLKDMDLDGSESPIWSSAYKAKSRTWGAHWCSDFSGKYGFVSHDLRRNVVTKLGLAGVSPFIIHAITKQKVPGMSDVIATYTRPTTEQLRETMELI